MTATEVLASLLESSLHLVQWTLGDFTDAEMLERPTPVSASVAWQIGHLAKEESGMIGRKTAMPPLPDDFVRKIIKDTRLATDPAALPTKQELLDQFTRTRQATIAWVRSLDPARLAEPNDVFAQVCPQLHHLIELQVNHTMMHLGQWQVVRRLLNKPILM